MKTEAMNLTENKQGYMSKFRKKEKKEKLCDNITLSKKIAIVHGPLLH